MVPVASVYNERMKSQVEERKKKELDLPSSHVRVPIYVLSADFSTF